jgi:hypothetical protein
MNNQINELSYQQNETLDYHSLKNNLYSIYKLCSQNLIQQQNITDINQIKINEIILHIKSSINNLISFQTQLQNIIIKLEADTRHFLKREFQFNIQKHSLESKVKAYMNMEEEYQELKEKMHYSQGKFLENDRKDHEILILKKENSSIKKDITKLEKKNIELEERINKDQNIIDELKLKNDKLTNIISELKKQNFQNMRSNSSINLNIINNNNINPNKNKKNALFLKQKNAYLNSPKSSFNSESLNSNFNINYSSNKTKFDYTSKNKEEFNLDNNRNYITNYNKIFNINGNNGYGQKKNRNRSISMLLDDYDKKENYFWMNNSTNKFLSNINGKTINKINQNSLPKYKLSLSNKNESLANLRNMKDMPKKIIRKKWNIKGNNSIFIKRISQKTIK